MLLNDREIRVNSDYTFTWLLYRHGFQILPTSATVNVWSSSGGGIISDAVAHIDSDGTVTYILAAANIAHAPEYNHRIELTYVYNGNSNYVNELFDVVETPIVNCVIDDDLYTYVPDMESISVYDGVTTDSSTVMSTWLISDRLSHIKQSLDGGRLEIHLPDETVIRTIISYDTGTGVLTYTPSTDAMIPIDTRFTARGGYGDVIGEAFEIVRQTLRNRAKVASAYIDGHVVKRAVIYKAIALYSTGVMEIDGDKWQLRAETYERMYNDEIMRLSEPTDYDGDGQIGEYEDDSRRAFTSIEVRTG